MSDITRLDGSTGLGGAPTRRVVEHPGAVPAVLPFVAAVAAGLALPSDPRLSILCLFFVALIAIGLGGFESFLHVLIASVFVESVSLGGTLRVGRALAIGAIVAIVLRAASTAWRPPRLRLALWMPAAAFTAWAWSSAFWARDHSAWSFALGQLGLAICFFAAFALMPDRVATISRLLRTFVIGALLATLIGLAQMAHGTRAAGLQGDPNIYALYQAAAIAAAVGLARAAGRRARWWLLTTVPLAASVVASQSRGGLVTTAVVIVWAVARPERLRAIRPRHVILGLAVAAAVALAVPSVPSIRNRATPQHVEEDRASGRIDIWYVAWRSVHRHPWLGLGAGNFKSHSIELLVTEPGVELVKSHLLLTNGIEVHNVYLETLAEYGVIGFAAFVMVLIATARALRRARRDRPGAPTLDALPGMLLAFATGAFFLSVVNNKLLWALVGLAASLHATPRRAAPIAPTLIEVT
jgi:O-antigen ligase